jgi:methylene-tetrahydromethanopterin dehydrogenase
MERPYILHLITPAAHVSPFDVNMAADAGYQVLMPYHGIDMAAVAGLTQDAIFSRGPKGVARTGLFVGGRDVLQAADMLDAARKAMVPPFVVSVFADPSGAYTTAAAGVAAVQAQLRRGHSTELRGKHVLVIGGTGPVGRIAGVLADRQGATVRSSSSKGLEAAERAVEETNRRFGSRLIGVSGGDAEALRASLAEAEVVISAATAGVEAVSVDDLARATRLLVAADMNAVPPAGIAGVGPMDNGKPLPGTQAVAIGALAIGNLKYQVQHRLLVRMRTSEKPVSLSFAEAFDLAGEVLAEAPAT